MIQYAWTKHENEGFIKPPSSGNVPNSPDGKVEWEPCDIKSGDFGVIVVWRRQIP